MYQYENYSVLDYYQYRRNMDFLKKEISSQTTESYYSKLPLGEKQTHNMPFVSQIQELLSVLVQKKSELKQGKLKQTNLIGKEQQQQIRISKIKIALEHEIEKEQLTRSQQERLQQEINISKQSIKQLTKNLKSTKSELGEVLEDIISGKKNKIDLENFCTELTYLVSCKTQQNAKLDEHVENLETLILSMQNDVRSKQDELTNLELKKNELLGLIDYLSQKIKTATRAKNSSLAQNNELSVQIEKSEQKLFIFKKQGSELEWNCEQIKAQNNQIEEINMKLSTDLESVLKHLATMEKMNKLLQNSLAQFGVTGEKVTRMISAAKTY